MPDTILGTGQAVVNQTDKVLILKELMFEWKAAEEVSMTLEPLAADWVLGGSFNQGGVTGGRQVLGKR